jgi:hypothetical protein
MSRPHARSSASWWLFAAVSVACAPGPEEDHRLDPAARATRVSLALRGVRPSVAELGAVVDEPALLPVLTDRWLTDEAFLATVRDLHAEVYSVRADTRGGWPAVGPVTDETSLDLYTSLYEAPLRLVEDVVARDRPYREILTAPYTLTDRRLALMEGMAYDPTGPEWQRTVHPDGRPEAGVLSTTGLWQRWWTNFSGHHRNRANTITRAFLCDEIGALDIPVRATFVPGSESAAADELLADPTCAGCHTTLEPLSAYLWGFDYNAVAGNIRERENLEPGTGYPLRYWDATRAEDYVDEGITGPAFYGKPGTDLRDLAVDLADDPRFASCAIEQAWGFLAQSPDRQVPDDVRVAAEAAFGRRGDWKAMVRAVVLSPAFLDERRTLVLRPEALARNVQDSTGHRWELEVERWGTTPVLASSRAGVRDLAGGTDHWAIERPTFTPSAASLEVWDAVARRAATAAVEAGTGIDPTVVDEVEVRAQLVDLVGRSTGALVAPDDGWVDELYALFAADLATSDPAHAWTIAWWALLSDPAALTY